MSRLEKLNRRRERLVRKTTVQRDAFARDFAPLVRPLSFADRGLVAVRYLRAHPSLVVVGVAVVVALRPRRALIWAGRGLAAWRTYRWTAARLRRFAG